MGFSLSVFSQENSRISDTVYIESMDSKLNLKLDVDSDIESFLFNDENSGTSYLVTPNVDYKAELSLNYRFISFKIGFEKT